MKQKSGPGKAPAEQVTAMGLNYYQTSNLFLLGEPEMLGLVYIG